VYPGIRFRAIESRQEASAAASRRSIEIRVRDYGGNRGRFSNVPSTEKTIDPGERFSLIGCDRSQRVFPLLSSFLLYLLCSARLSLSFRLFSSLPYRHGFYYTVCFSLFLPCQRNHRPNHILLHIVIACVISPNLSRNFRMICVVYSHARASSKDVTLVHETPGNKRKITG